MILIDETDKDIAIPFVIPSAIVGRRTGNKILSYIRTTSRKATTRIFRAKTVLGSRPAPRVAAFSSKGPNVLTPEILKPDVTAPGLNILAAWSPASSGMQFNILSGTSMACPHVTGIATLIKAVHPLWSPSAIKSAIMTTATIHDKSQKPITVDPQGRRGSPFDYGSGFVNPTRVLAPGLVYDANPTNYESFLCSLKYAHKSLQLIAGHNVSCDTTLTTASNLNYPSITVHNLRRKMTVTRIVTNVGRPRSVYRAVVSSPAGIKVCVEPERLVFYKRGQMRGFTISFEVMGPVKGYLFGFLTWKSGKSRVTSPLVIRIA